MALIQKQRELAYEALASLAGGVGMSQFLNFLAAKGASDLRKEMVEEGIGEIFQDEKASGLRNGC